MRKTLIFAAVLVIGVIYLYVERWGSTPTFRDGSGAVLPGSVATMERIKLGGVEQSVTLRGRSSKAPILIWLHGGPGTDETGMWRHYNAALEDRFVVVYWTQRGTGRSYSADIPVSAMTLRHFVSDLDQLVGILQARFHQQKVVLVGHSWGTNIGVSYARAHPGRVAAFVGIGQIANSVEGERRSYAFALGEARRRNDAEALTALAGIGPPPYPLESIMIERRWLEKFGGGSFHMPTSLLQLLVTSFKASEVTWYDGVKFKAGADFSLAALAPQVAGFDWMNTATRFEVPIFLVAGRHDRNTDADLAHAYFKRIEAPFKQFKWFEKSAHSPQFEEAAAFNAFMRNEVLPVVAVASRTKPGSAHVRAEGDLGAKLDQGEDGWRDGGGR